VTPAHRPQPPKRLSRRGLLGLAAAAAVPAAGTVAFRHAEAGSGAAPGKPATGQTVPAAATPTATAGPGLRGGGVVPHQAGKVMLGSYLDLAGLTPQKALALRRSQLGRDPRIVHLFYGWTDTLPTSISYLPANAIPMISWRGCDYGDILGGSADGLILAAARNLRKLRRPTLLRWGWEMNGDWYAWGGWKNAKATGNFIKCWQRVHSLFARAGADNISWVWSLNWNSRPDVPGNQYANYYPGDKYVDWVAVDGYNLHRELPGAMFDEITGRYGTRKPIMISEVGSVDRGGRTKADWISAFAGWVQQTPEVGAVAWFDTDTHPTYHERWRIDTDAESLAAYKAMADNPYFGG
jgi:hypothetical protein